MTLVAAQRRAEPKEGAERRGPLPSEREFIIVGGDVATRSAVIAAMASEAGLAYGGVCRDLPAMAHLLEQQPAAVVFVDMDSDVQPARLLAQLEGATARYPKTRFIVLAGQLSSALVLQAMQAGARHVQAKQGIAAELRDVVRRLVAAAGGRLGASGSAVTVLSASGGCGATTIAVNLANELQLLAKRQALVVDLDYAYGAVATYLELHGQFGIADVKQHPTEIDAQLIQSTAVRHSDSLHALLSPASTGNLDPRPLTSDRLDSLLLACKQAYRITVADAPRVSLDVATTLARASVLTLIVLQPSVKDARVAKSLLQGLRGAGVQADRVRPILNRHRTRQMVPIDDIRQALGEPSIECLSNDYPSVIRSINYGKLLSESAPRSTVRREIAALANQVQSRQAKQNGAL